MRRSVIGLAAAIPMLVGAQAFADSLETLANFCVQDCSTLAATVGQPSALVMDREGNLFGTTPSGGTDNVCTVSNGCVYELKKNADGSWGPLTVLYEFCSKPNCTDGAVPMGLLFGTDGKLYGTTMVGGKGFSGKGNCLESCGTVFELTPNATQTHWTEHVIHNFCETLCGDGAQPAGPLIADGDGNLYGTTSAGGAFGGGTAFKLSFNSAKAVWTETVLYAFCAANACIDGVEPTAPLVMDKAGNLFGTARGGGGPHCPAETFCGIVFELTPNAKGTKWSETVLHRFCSNIDCRDGTEESPGVQGLVLDRRGNLFGVAGAGGRHCRQSNGCGVVFELTPVANKRGWAYHEIYSFCSLGKCTDGAFPMAALLVDRAGTLYGTTQQGGAQNWGTAFSLSPDASGSNWAETVLHSFCEQKHCADGQFPEAALITDRNGNLYGTTAGSNAIHEQPGERGTVFVLRP